jgi:hypothetical protein
MLFANDENPLGAGDLLEGLLLGVQGHEIRGDKQGTDYLRIAKRYCQRLTPPSKNRSILAIYAAKL